MNICYVCTNLTESDSNGLYTIELAKKLNKNFKIHALVGNYDMDLSTNIEIHKRPFFTKKQSAINSIFNTFYLPFVRKKYSIDIVHSQFLTLLNPDIVTMHGCYKAYYEKMKKLNLHVDEDALLRLSFKIGENLVLKKAKLIISVSKGLKKELIKYYNIPKEKIRVIPNGVDLNKFKPNIKKRKKIREKLNIAQNAKVLIYTGGDFKRKGVKEIILALKKIRGNVKFIITGKGDIDYFKELAKKNNVIDIVIFTGFVPKIEDYYCAADIFVFPSVYEAFSLSTLEASASGLPLIVTKINGTEELVREGENGFFIKRDSIDIAEKVNLLIKDEKLMKQMSKNSRKIVEREYSWERCAKRTAEVYEELLRR
jgi:UDP-glucose:(heptosyl)LPS alpha-1,3-glucosyltransferase